MGFSSRPRLPLPPRAPPFLSEDRDREEKPRLHQFGQYLLEILGMTRLRKKYRTCSVNFLDSSVPSRWRDMDPVAPLVASALQNFLMRSLRSMPSRLSMALSVEVESFAFDGASTRQQRQRWMSFTVHPSITRLGYATRSLWGVCGLLRGLL